MRQQRDSSATSKNLPKNQNQSEQILEDVTDKLISDLEGAIDEGDTDQEKHDAQKEAEAEEPEPSQLQPNQQADSIESTRQLSKLRYRVNQPLDVNGGLSHGADGSLLVLNHNGVLRAYSANKVTYHATVEESWRIHLTQVAVGGLGPGNSHDSCGRWLQGIYSDGQLVRGWYHSESHCNYSLNLQTHKSMAYAESYDG